MTPTTAHFAFGMAVATLAIARPLWRTWRDGRPVARWMALGLTLSVVLGVWAMLPALLRRWTGIPTLGRAWGWNLFLLYPLLNRLRLPSIVVGEALIGGMFMLQYTILLLAIRRAQRTPLKPPEWNGEPIGRRDGV